MHAHHLHMHANLPIIASLTVLFWGAKITPIFLWGKNYSRKRGVKITPIFIWGKNYSRKRGVKFTPIFIWGKNYSLKVVSKLLPWEG